MSVVQGTIQGGSLAGTVVSIVLPTVRYNELPLTLAPQGTDLMTLYQTGNNSVVAMTMDILRNYMVTGGNPAALTPVVYGGDVEILITSQMAGQSQVNVPALAGEMFTLDRVFQGQLFTNEYYVLQSGGFQLRPKNANGDVVSDTDPSGVPQLVNEGDKFIAHVFSLRPGTTTPTQPSAVSLFTGKEDITTDTQLSTIHRGKLIHCAFGSNHGTITLEDVLDIPVNSIVCIETSIDNTYDTKVSGRNGQKIYYLNSSHDELYLGVGKEFIWLFVGTDGYYVTNASEGLFNVGDISYGYKQKLGTLICKGQEVNRIDYPRLWQWVQSLGLSLIDDMKWNTSVSITGAPGTRTFYKPYEGCFSYGPGGVNGTTFRLPNLQEKFMRSLNSIGGSDSQRMVTVGTTTTSNNQSGSIQPDDNKAHDHDVDYELNGTDGTANGRMLPGGNAEHNGNGTDTNSIKPGGGFESRGINVGLLPLINT